MQQIEQKGYSCDDIIDVLQHKKGSRKIKFRYDLLNKDEVKIGELYNVESGEVTMNSLSENIKRTARFKVKDDKNVDWLNDRIQPIFMLEMPDSVWLEWPLGIFLLSSPNRQEKNRLIYREIEAYDGLQVLMDDKIDYRLYIAAGTKYISAVTSILSSAGITKINLEPCDDVLAVDREWNIGTGKLKIINELLKDINYTQIWVDERGYYTASEYTTPQERSPEYVYKDDSMSVICPGVEEVLDLSKVPNKFIVVVSNAETAPLTSIYINQNPESPVSTVSRGRVIANDVVNVDFISSQAALDEYAKRFAFNATQVYGLTKFDTAVMPMHSFDDVIQIEYGPLQINSKYSETSWTMPLKAGGKMKHEVRKVIQV